MIKADIIQVIALDKQLWDLVFSNLDEPMRADLRPCNHYQRLLGLLARDYTEDTEDEPIYAYMTASAQLQLHIQFGANHPTTAEVLKQMLETEEGQSILRRMEDTL